MTLDRRPKVTKIGSIIIGHRIDYYGVGILRGQRHTGQQKLTQITPPPATTPGIICDQQRSYVNTWSVLFA